MSLFPRASLAIVLLALASGGAHAQNATTTPVGVVNVQLDANQRTAISLPLEKPAVAFGTVTAVTPTAITSSSLNLGNLTAPHFVRLKTGNATGRVLRVSSNNATTLSFQIGTGSWQLPVDSSSGNSLNVSVGDRFEVIPMWTLADLFGTNQANCVLRTATNPNSADQVTIYADGGFATYFNNQSNWRNASNPGDTTNYNDLGISPVGGIWILRRSTGSNAVLTFTGEVPDTAPRYHLPGGSTFAFGAPIPSGLTLGNMGLSAMPSWNRNNNPNNADQVTVYRPDRTLGTFFLNASGVWRNASNPGDTTNYSTVEIPAGSGFGIRRRGSASGPIANTASSLPYSLN